MSDIHTIQKNLLAWFASHARKLPWRTHYAPYQVWISEIMLQQTQMERVLTYFQRWMRRFPDPAAVAAAGEDEVLKLWEGLGYYSRARNIRRAAQILVDDYEGEFPQDFSAIRALPGIGDYTAGAIASIAFNQDVPAVDANVERVLARLLDIDTPVKERKARARIREAASGLICQGRAREVNQGLMELGALICRPRTPQCETCPLHGSCEARRLGIVLERPVPGKSKAIVPLDVVSGVLIHNGRIFIQKRLPQGVWANLWEFPGGRIEPGESPAQALVREYREETGFGIENLETIRVIRHGYTTYRITLHTFFCSLREGRTDPVLTAAQECRWVVPADLGRYAFPAGHRKLIDTLARDLRFQARVRA
ncbi:MAG: A/G-specific adenine glycosylase [Desulfovibrionales bacterium]